MPVETDTPIRPEARSSHRPASVTLRSGGRDEGALDPANQSLAEALGLVFRILQIAMFVLFGAFIFSGVSSVKENQSGIRLLFGRPTGRNLPPGPHFSAPFPLGEMVRVDTGQTVQELDESFWPRLSPEQRSLSMGQLGTQGKPALKPGEDGSLITADFNLAHAQWSVRYQRGNPFDFAQNILPENERDIVMAAVERGIVHAVAGVTIDDLLKQSSTDQASVATRAKELAQHMLDDLHSGLRIDQLTLREKVPPFLVYNDFANVQSEEQNASKRRDDAQTRARNTLNGVAGAAHEPLIRQIDAYEQAIARKDVAGQEQVLGTINALLDGREVKVGDTLCRAGLITGQVTNMMNTARQYRTTVVRQREAELATFKAKLAQYKANPNVVVQREWTDAMVAFLNKPLVEIFNLPAGTSLAEFHLNRDPEWVKQAGAAARTKMAADAAEKRALEHREEFLKTRTDKQVLDSR